MLREMRSSVCSATIIDINHPDIGEEDIDGVVNDGTNLTSYAELSPCSHASLAGRVTLELIRRLELEIRGDEVQLGLTPWQRPKVTEDNDDTSATDG